jgi:hypothetical protein
LSDSVLEGRFVVVTDAGGGLGGGICSALTLGRPAVARVAASLIMGQMVEIDGGWAMH